MQALVPVKANEREIFMDVLRGFAILGIFIANLNGFSWYREIPRSEAGPYLLPEADRVILFFSMPSYLLFSCPCESSLIKLY